MFDSDTPVMWFEIKREGVTERFMIPNPTGDLYGRLMVAFTHVPGVAFACAGTGSIIAEKASMTSKFSEFPVDHTYQISMNGHQDLQNGTARYSKTLHEFIYKEVSQFVENAETQVQNPPTAMESAEGASTLAEGSVPPQGAQEVLQVPIAVGAAAAQPVKLADQIRAQMQQAAQTPASVASHAPHQLSLPAPAMSSQEDLTATLKAQFQQQQASKVNASLLPGPVMSSTPSAGSYGNVTELRQSAINPQPIAGLKPTVYGNEEIVNRLERIEAAVVHLVKGGKGDEPVMSGAELSEWFQNYSRKNGWDATFNILAQQIKLPIL